MAHRSRAYGILGGTFDPIHYGHLYIAEQARQRLNLDLVYFVTNKIPVHKSAGANATAEQRHQMAILATRENPQFICSRIELDRETPSYAINTVESIQTMLGDDADLHFIIGADSVPGLPEWHRYQDLLELDVLCVVDRPGWEAGADKFSPPLRRVDIAPIDVSSTMIRCELARNLSPRYLLPDSVIEYIRSESLYVGRDVR